MAMEMRLNLKMTQKLVMTPMLQQAIKLLPLAKLELAQLVRQEIIDNPILEEILDDEPEEYSGESMEKFTDDLDDSRDYQSHEENFTTKDDAYVSNESVA